MALGLVLAVVNQAAAALWLSDLPERLVLAEQAWGELGFDTAAHASGRTGEPLQIGPQRFAKGLGHHAQGTLVVQLDGEFAAFQAQVGLQPCGGNGSVVFRVFVDGALRFDSGVLRATNAPVAVEVDLTGAQELRLEAGDAGDGITCDMANWAEARLVPATNQPVLANPPVDVAPFARVVTWDPNRMDGARASRIEELRAEDVFLETELARLADGTFAVPVSTNGLACVGLQWLNRRALHSVSLEFAEAADLPATNAVQVQGWFGESAWQGRWKRLQGVWQIETNRLVFQLSPRSEGPGLLQVQKVRWVYPAAVSPAPVRNLTAFTRSRWATGEFVCEAEGGLSGEPGTVRVLNGEWVGAAPGPWNRTEPLVLKVRYSRPWAVKSDATVLQFALPTGTVGVAVEDLLTNDCVYLPDHGLFVARYPAPTTLKAYQQKIAGRRTILQEVRQMPDQTLAQAMVRTHHAFQREGPVMLSLACHNTKFVLERDGDLRFPAVEVKSDDWAAAAAVMDLTFGDGQRDRFERRLEGGWLPMPVITIERAGIRYRQRAWVAPTELGEANLARVNRRSLCVLECTAENLEASPRSARFQLRVKPPASKTLPVNFTPTAPAHYAAQVGQMQLQVATEPTGTLDLEAKGESLTLAGMLAPGGRAQWCVFVGKQEDRRYRWEDAPTLRAATEVYWRAWLAPAMQIETPDHLLNDVIRASQVRCLIAARHEADGERIAPWIAAMSYGPLESEAHSVIRGMDFLGHHDFARRGLEFFIHRYHTNGFLTTGYTTFGTAWHLWTLGEHFQLSRDTNWLRQVAPEITRVGHWILRQLAKTRRTAPGGGPVPEFGLMPPGVLADWNAYAYHFCLNAYYYAALRELGAMLGAVGEAEAPKFALAAAELRENILRAYRWTQGQSPALALRDGTWIPHYPSQVHSPGRLGDFFPGQDAGRSWCYDVELGAHQLVPTGVLAANDREVTRLQDHMEDVQFLADGWFDYPAASNQADWFNLGGFSKVQPYYTRNAEIYALRDEVKPFLRSYCNALASLLNPEVLTFWEHFRHSGAWDKTHETGYFLHQTRVMLVQERGEELWLAPLITSNWLQQGAVVAVSNAPTRFGPVHFRLHSRVAEGRMEATVDSPTRRSPAAIVLRLRHPAGRSLRAVLVDGQLHRDFDARGGTVRLSGAAGRRQVVAEY